MEKWKECKLKDIIEFNPKESIPKGSAAKKIEMTQLTPFCRDVIGYTKEVFYSGTKFRNGDTIMARITPCLENGKTAKISLLNDNEIGFGSTEYIVLRAKKGIADADYIYYLATSSDVREGAIKSMVGSSGRQRVQLDVVKNLEISCPSYTEQQKLTKLLRLLDDKIELNRQINTNLEQQAQAIFKSWFIDFEPFGGTMPDDWNEYRLGDFLPVVTGKKNANISSEKGRYPFFSCSQTISWTDEYSFDANAILVAGNGDFNVKWYNGKFEAYQRTYVLIPTISRYTSWLYYAVKFHLSEITKAARGSVINFITKGNLEDFRFIGPKDINNFTLIDQFTAINSAIDNNIKEIYTLSSLRDTLLPKLMSGEIDVSKIELE
ncbi:restriction endonuclease subunit S [Treponema sp. OMZ 855]|uniref:restriction endonuclease subunit S n=2 Tax=unclassified Treponema TaxID=2638727 RepID=UPI0020A415E5|nr:restriction endonuclease subunit S [Treponema sp. OMZ 855]